MRLADRGDRADRRPPWWVDLIWLVRLVAVIGVGRALMRRAGDADPESVAPVVLGDLILPGPILILALAVFAWVRR